MTQPEFEGTALLDHEEAGREAEQAEGGASASPAALGAGLSQVAAQSRYEVLLLSKDSLLANGLLAHFNEGGRCKLKAISRPIGEAESELTKIDLPDVAIIDLTSGSTADVEALERLRKSRFLKLPIVAISNPLDQPIMRGLMRIKVDDWLPAHSQPLEIELSCEAAIRSRLLDSDGSSSSCLSFFPAIGGCGNTTLAIQTAFLIANKTRQPQSVCLVDLNFQDGSIADYLDLAPAFKLSEIDTLASRLDRHLLDVMLSRHRSGLAVLAAPSSPGQALSLDEAFVASFLGLLSETFRHVIIDLPKTWQSWTDNVIWGSDRVFVVTGFNVPALRQGRSVADAMAAKAAASTGISVIVNKFKARFIGAGLTRKDVEAILENRLGGLLPDLGGTVDEAINRGTPISELRSGKKLEKQLAEIVFRDSIRTKDRK